MLEFLKVTHSPVDVAQRLEKDATVFQRNHSSKVFEPYTKKKRDVVERNLKDLIAQLRRKNNGNTLGIEEYLLTTAYLENAATHSIFVHHIISKLSFYGCIYYFLQNTV